MYTEKQTIDHLLSRYTVAVREQALEVLLEYGFIGLDPRSDAPSTYKALRAFWDNPQRSKYFPVYTGGNENTVFDDPVVNLLFRAWHDIGHCILDARFTRDDEKRVGQWQAAMLSGVNKQILLADVCDQIDYYYDNGKFVEDQRSFVINKVFG